MTKLVFGAMVVLQLLIPAWMIVTYETTLQEGRSFRFKVQPIDPADPFRGRFVRLDFAAERGLLPASNRYDRDNYREPAFALIGQDSDGFARIEKLLKSKPVGGDFIRVEVYHTSGREYNVAFPFDRYYAEESKAPAIEARVRDLMRSADGDLFGPHSVSADVRIHSGRGVIAELYINELTIHQFLEQQRP